LGVYAVFPVAIVALATLFAGSGYTQDRPLTAAEKESDVSFEVASVRENHRTREDGASPRIRGILPSGYYEATYVRLLQLISVAYDVQAYQIIGGPDWIRTARFDIIAKAPERFEPRQTKAMLRRLLERRFGLVVRREMKRMPTYSLVWDNRRHKPGPGIRTPSPLCDDLDPLTIRESTTTPARPARGSGESSSVVRGPEARTVDPAECRGGSGFSLDGWIFLRRAPLSSLLPLLSREVGRPVLDKTGLAGTFNVDLKWSFETSPADPETADFVRKASSSVFTAVREQLGMRLERAHEEIEMLSVERVERPTPD
jgi:uncharacterized protein (TIGR03435 family)